MADTGWLSPASTGETYNDLNNPTNAYASNDSYAGPWPQCSTMDVAISHNGGTNYTTHSGTLSHGSTDSYLSMGGSTDDWGRTWSDTELSNSNFRVRLEMAGSLPGFQDYYDFSPSIPSGATIDGIEVSIEGKVVSTRFSTDYYVDHVRLKVYYTETTTVDKTIQAKARIATNGITKTIQAKANVKNTASKTVQAKASINGVRVLGTELVSPDHIGSGTSPVIFVWEIATNQENEPVHSQIQIDDTSDAFGSLEIDQKSWEDNTGMEYWNGSSWVEYPLTGVTSTYFGNQARLTVALTDTQKWWRVRGASG